MRGIGSSALRGPSYLGAGRRIGRLPPAPIPQAFGTFRSGYVAQPASESMSRWLAGPRQSHLQIVSGLRGAMRYTAPLVRSGAFTSSYVGTPYFPPEPQGDAFHQFFGLMPARERPQTPQADQAPRYDSLSAILEEYNQRYVEELTARALEAFKVATAADVVDRAEALAEAQRLLKVACDLDREAYIPALLLVHATLERGQIGLAVLHLGEAVRRRPGIFSERPELAVYFGDPALLDEQMRRHLRIGDDNPTYEGAYALQAYCAWVLDDPARVRYALEQMAAASRKAETLPDPRLARIRFALAAALK